MLRTLARLFPSRHSRAKAHRAPVRPAARRFRPALETLEDRTVLSTVFLVAPNQPTDGSHFTNLNSAVSSAGPGGTIMVEPGSIGGTYSLFGTNTGANANNITIMGDPNAGPINLPSFNFFLSSSGSSQGANGVTLSGLNLGFVVIGAGANGERVLNSQINQGVFISGGVTNSSNNGNNLISGNLVSGTVTETGFSANDQIVNNTFNTTVTGIIFGAGGISVSTDNGLTIRNNVLNLTGSRTNTGTVSAISVFDSNGAVIDSNTININLDSTLLTMTPTGLVEGIDVSDTGANPGYITTLVQLNNINTHNLLGGVGLFISSVGQTNANTAVTVQGNDFHGNATGVQYVADPADATPLATTLGGQAQTGGAVSLGGNDFRGTNLAVNLTTTTGAAFTGTERLAAQMNIFAGTPNTASATGGSVDTSNQLSNARAFVQVLYEKLTGNVVGLSQLDAFVGFINSFGSAGQEFVAAELQFSTLGLGHLVDTVSQSLVGHPLSASLRSSLVFQLQTGASLESVEAQIIAGQDFYTATGGNPLNAALAKLTGVTASPTTALFLQQLQFATGTNGQTNGVQGTALLITQTLQARAQAVDALFTQLFHRAPSGNELSFNTVFGGSLLNIELGLLSTQEFFNNG